MPADTIGETQKCPQVKICPGLFEILNICVKTWVQFLNLNLTTKIQYS